MQRHSLCFEVKLVLEARYLVLGRHTMLSGWRQEFSDGGLTLSTRGLKYGFQGTINAKNLQKNRFSPSDGGLPCSDKGTIAP